MTERNATIDVMRSLGWQQMTKDDTEWYNPRCPIEYGSYGAIWARATGDFWKVYCEQSDGRKLWDDRDCMATFTDDQMQSWVEDGSKVWPLDQWERTKPAVIKLTHSNEVGGMYLLTDGTAIYWNSDSTDIVVRLKSGATTVVDTQDADGFNRPWALLVNLLDARGADIERPMSPSEEREWEEWRNKQ